MSERKGWGFPLRSRKAHYFNNDIISLCRKWMYSGVVEDTNHGSTDNCKACEKKRPK